MKKTIFALLPLNWLALGFGMYNVWQNVRVVGLPPTSHARIPLVHMTLWLWLPFVIAALLLIVALGSLLKSGLRSESRRMLTVIQALMLAVTIIVDFLVARALMAMI